MCSDDVGAGNGLVVTEVGLGHIVEACLTQCAARLRAELHDLLPNILPQLGADNMATLRKLAEEGYGGAGGAGGGAPGGFGGPGGGGARPGVATIEEEDEDDGARTLAVILSPLLGFWGMRAALAPSWRTLGLARPVHALLLHSFCTWHGVSKERRGQSAGRQGLQGSLGWTWLLALPCRGACASIARSS